MKTIYHLEVQKLELLHEKVIQLMYSRKKRKESKQAREKDTAQFGNE